jgi:hypothetical protein
VIAAAAAQWVTQDQTRFAIELLPPSMVTKERGHPLMDQLLRGVPPTFTPDPESWSASAKGDR